MLNILFQFKAGDKVWLANVNDVLERVATATVFVNQSSFHYKPIEDAFVRLTINKVHVNVPLLKPVDDAEEYYLADAVGESVLWMKKLTFPHLEAQ